MSNATLCLIGNIMAWAYIVVVGGAFIVGMGYVIYWAYESIRDREWGELWPVGAIVGVIGYICLALYLQKFCG